MARPGSVRWQGRLFGAQVWSSCVPRLGPALLWWAGYFDFGFDRCRRSRGGQIAQSQGVPATHLANMSGTVLTHMVVLVLTMVQYEYMYRTQVIWSIANWRCMMTTEQRTAEKAGPARGAWFPTNREEIGPINKAKTTCSTEATTRQATTNNQPNALGIRK